MRPHYVMICGALPLVEGLLPDANGKWLEPEKYALHKRIDATDALTDDEELALTRGWSAVTMLLRGIDDVWKSERPRVGGSLNRNLILHGTGRELGTAENAVRTLLLTAAVAQVAERLLAPRI